MTSKFQFISFPIKVSQFLGYFPSHTHSFNYKNETNKTLLPLIVSVLWILFSIIFCAGTIIQRGLVSIYFVSHPCYGRSKQNSFFYTSILGWIVFQTMTEIVIRIECVRHSQFITQMWIELGQFFCFPKSSLEIESQLSSLKRSWKRRLLIYITISISIYGGMAYSQLEEASGCPFGLVVGKIGNLLVTVISCTHNFSLHTIEVYLQVLNCSINHRLLEIQRKAHSQNKDLFVITSATNPEKLYHEEILEFMFKLDRLLQKFNYTHDLRFTFELLNFIGIGSLLSYFVLSSGLRLDMQATGFTLILLLILLHSVYKFCEICTKLPLSYEQLLLTSVEYFEHHNYQVVLYSILCILFVCFNHLNSRSRCLTNFYIFSTKDGKCKQSFVTSTASYFLR